MTKRTEKDWAGACRGYLPFGVLVFFLSLIVAQFSVPGAAYPPASTGGERHAGQVKDVADPVEDGEGSAPRPLSSAGRIGGSDLWIPLTSNAERRAAKSKTGLPEGEGAAKAAFLAPRLQDDLFLPAPHRDAPSLQAQAGISLSAASFRSRAPPPVLI